MYGKEQHKHSNLSRLVLCGQQWTISLLNQTFLFTWCLRVNNRPNIVDTRVKGHRGELLCRLLLCCLAAFRKCWLKCERACLVKTSVTGLWSDRLVSKNKLVNARWSARGLAFKTHNGKVQK